MMSVNTVRLNTLELDDTYHSLPKAFHNESVGRKIVVDEGNAAARLRLLTRSTSICGDAHWTSLDNFKGARKLGFE